MNERQTRRQAAIIIVGGGASGVLLAAHLLRNPDADIRVTLIEKRPAFGQGLAYSTTLADHVLNVSALGMSAYADDPEHFWRWLSSAGLATEENPRGLRAAQRLWRLSCRGARRLARARRPNGPAAPVSEECVSVATTAAGVEVKLANGASLIGHVAVLAVGHEEQPSVEKTIAIRRARRRHADRSGRRRADPRHRPQHGRYLAVAGRPRPSRPDHRAVAPRPGLRRSTARASRSGWMPPTCRSAPSFPISCAGSATSCATPSGTAATGATSSTASGRSTSASGKAGRPSARRRFIEHTRAWWDIHRHRMPPELHERVTRGDRRRRAGTGRRKAGRRQARRRRLRGDHPQARRTATETLSVARIYDCTGITTDLAAGSNPIVRSLIDRGLARPDPLRIGLDVTRNCAIVEADGQPSERLYAIGPLTRGAFFEIDAIPDIRVQCAMLARNLTRAPAWWLRRDSGA